MPQVSVHAQAAESFAKAVHASFGAHRETMEPPRITGRGTGIINVIVTAEHAKAAGLTGAAIKQLAREKAREKGAKYVYQYQPAAGGEHHLEFRRPTR